MTIVPFSVILVVTLLCGRIEHPLRYNSSFTYTSSAHTVIPSILTHLPILLYQPMIEFEIQVLDLITTSLKTAVYLILTPFKLAYK